MDESKNMNKQPVFKAKAGKIDIAVWSNTNQQGSEYLNATITKNYYDEKEKVWKTTNSFSYMDLCDLILLNQKALEYIRIYHKKPDI